MQKFQNKYRIASARLQTWYYGWNGAYFITICTKDRLHYFGAVIDREMHLSPTGQLAHDYWLTIPDHFYHVRLGAFVVMPNHVHGIIVLDNPYPEGGGAGGGKPIETGQCPVSTTPDKPTAPPPTPGESRFQNPGKNTISTMVGAYKSIVSRHAHHMDAAFQWRSRFWDNIIRSQADYGRIEQYIRNNPRHWEKDCFRR